MLNLISATVEDSAKDERDDWLVINDKNAYTLILHISPRLKLRSYRAPEETCKLENIVEQHYRDTARLVKNNCCIDCLF